MKGRSSKGSREVQGHVCDDSEYRLDGYELGTTAPFTGPPCSRSRSKPDTYARKSRGLNWLWMKSNKNNNMTSQLSALIDTPAFYPSVSWVWFSVSLRRCDSNRIECCESCCSRRLPRSRPWDGVSRRCCNKAFQCVRSALFGPASIEPCPSDQSFGRRATFDSC